MKTWAWVGAVFFLLMTMGCAGGTGGYTPRQTCTDRHDDDICATGYEIVDRLVNNAHAPLSLDQIILVSCFVDVNNVQRTSNFGRMIAEHMASRLAQNGYTIVEVKLRDSLYVKEREGEFLLSRRLRDIQVAHDAQGVVVGTYLVTREDLYISARIVRAQDAKIISSCDMKIPLTEDLKATLW